jgi:hypothetical protein
MKRSDLEHLLRAAGRVIGADQIDGAIGEASMFHETFGVYAQGVGYETITAPDGWRDRLIGYSNDNTGGVTGLCLEINDLWLTKLAAGRPKDFEFCRALVRARLIPADIVRSRTPTIDKRIDADELAARVERLLANNKST